LKRVLQGVFESTYSFELESLKKQNISQAIKHLEKLGGSTPFVLAYATQVALGGHAIPLDRGALDTLFVLGILSEAEARSGKVTGFERVIPKNKGVEFASLLHQLAADYHSNPFSPNVRKLMLSINPDAKDRFPKRGAKKEPEKAEPAAAKKGTGERPVAKSPEKPPDKAHAKHGDRAVEKSAARTSEKPSDKHHDKQAGKHPPHPSGKRPEPPAEKPATEKPAAKKKAAAEKSSAKPHPVSPKRKPATKQLAKRKPR
jgi:endonuclease-3